LCSKLLEQILVQLLQWINFGLPFLMLERFRSLYEASSNRLCTRIRSPDISNNTRVNLVLRNKIRGGSKRPLDTDALLNVVVMVATAVASPGRHPGRAARLADGGAEARAKVRIMVATGGSGEQ
jgi:hypothetical protein